jgi:hypothetical protein
VPTSNLIRLSGLAAVLAGVFFLITELLDLLLYAAYSQELPSLAVTSPLSLLEGVVGLIGVMLLVVALVGLYARQSGAAGLLSTVGFVVALIGTALVMGRFWDSIFVEPVLAQAAPALIDAGPPLLVTLGGWLSTGLFVVGWLLFGIATLRARVYPRIAVVLVLVGTVLTAIPLPLTTVVFGAGVAWMGLALFAGMGLSAGQQQPSRVR